ncbi:hypothetical protein CHLRE_03g146027v5 [Chlamydomonas reinhardtii]|uniref:Uncharacterized protein n=1 Tax=Chlamydomonas reinhardtii TaxID=3055 RepID=A0A2K3DVE7_CHLRE|nr:uncharacterized protein CHLRE_03g146027v5 [Chlamydomonas reinhardtii]PNW84496.1 hypothetical protein CHLRE_03g146027v5 [Chlamydomonas reinhardtii]
MVGGLLPGDCGVDEDDDDARARERFLWDLGAWLEFSNEQAALRRHAAAEAAEAAAVAAAMREATSGSRGIPTYTPLLRPSADGIVDYFASPLAPGLPPSTAEGGGNASASAAASVAAPSVEAAAAACNMTPGMQGSLRRTALELLGFACSRGWAAVSTHIVLGLMDMGLSMTAINAAVQAAHGWSALHLAAASGSPELMGMMLWRSYGAGAAAGAAGAGAAGAGAAAGEMVGADEGERRGTAAAAAAGGGSARRRGGGVAEEWRAMVAAHDELTRVACWSRVTLLH